MKAHPTCSYKLSLNFCRFLCSLCLCGLGSSNVALGRPDLKAFFNEYLCQNRNLSEAELWGAGIFFAQLQSVVLVAPKQKKFSKRELALEVQLANQRDQGLVLSDMCKNGSSGWLISAPAVASLVTEQGLHLKSATPRCHRLTIDFAPANRATVEQILNCETTKCPTNYEPRRFSESGFLSLTCERIASGLLELWVLMPIGKAYDNSLTDRDLISWINEIRNSTRLTQLIKAKQINTDVLVEDGIIAHNMTH